MKLKDRRQVAPILVGVAFIAFIIGVIVSSSLKITPNIKAVGEEVVESLRVQAEDLGEEGLDQYYGWGLVDAGAVVTETPISESFGVVSLILIVSATTMVLALEKVHVSRKRGI